MANTIKWSVRGLNCYPRKNGVDNVVYQVLWNCTVTNADDPTKFVSHDDATELNTDFGIYTPYTDLTEQQVLAWVHEAISPVVRTIEQALEERLYVQSLPPTVSPDLPW
jgi:hypothetical protein